MTLRQLKSLTAPLLTRNQDLIRRDRWLYLKPIRHVVRAVKIEATGSARYASVIAFVDFSFNLSGAAWGWPLGQKGRSWEWTDSQMQPAFEAALEDDFIPEMRALDTLIAFEQFASRPMTFMTSPLPGHRDCQLRVDIAMGRLDKALVDCRKLLQDCGPPPYVNYFTRLWSNVAVPALPLLERRDIAGLASLLHEWEQKYVTGHRLEAIHEPTPFPLELQSP